jgi:hypothetical protein
MNTSAEKSVPASTSPKPETKRQKISRMKHNAALSRWESVKRERFLWLKPFRELSIEKAMAYLEELRRITEEAGHILQERIAGDKSKIICGTCKENLEGTLPTGKPKYIAKIDHRDKKNPEIIRSLYFCSQLCYNTFARKHGGAFGGTG